MIGNGKNLAQDNRKENLRRAQVIEFPAPWRQIASLSSILAAIEDVWKNDPRKLRALRRRLLRELFEAA